jgi:hypothetical protein
MTYGAQPALLWLAIEAELAIVCASVPALRKFFQTARKVISTRKSTTNTTGEKFQPSGPSDRLAHKSRAHEFGQQSVSLDSDGEAGSEQEMVSYDHHPKVRPAASRGTFYEEDSIDIP